MTNSYVLKAVEGEVGRVRGAGRGGRAMALFAAAAALGSLIAGGALVQAEMEALLLEAAHSVGLSMREATATIRSGFRTGARRPRPIASSSASIHPTKLTSFSIEASPNRYPPVESVKALWGAGAPVGDDPAVCAWLVSRGLDLSQIELWNLARALPADSLPGWARVGRASWFESGYRVMIPLYDAQGRMRSLRARSLSRTNDIKEVAPSGFQVAGLVMACPLAVQALTGSGPYDVVQRFLIVEGGVDFLTWACCQSDATEEGPAVLGVFSGSWTTDLAERIPAGMRVTFRYHHDDAGRRYLLKVGKTLEKRCNVQRGTA